MRLSMYYEQKTKTTQKNTKKPPKNKNIYFIYVYLSNGNDDYSDPAIISSLYFVCSRFEN